MILIMVFSYQCAMGWVWVWENLRWTQIFRKGEIWKDGREHETCHDGGKFRLFFS